MIYSLGFFGAPKNPRLIYEVKRLKFYKVGVISKEGWARPRFFWYDNDKDLKACFLVTRLMLLADVMQHAECN